MKNPVLDFIARWQDKGYEKGETQQFWIDLLATLFNVEKPEQWFTFEQHVPSVGFIDARIPRTRVLIEQKGADKDLRKPAPQSDGTLLTPFLQAKRYADWLPTSERPRWIVVCNFHEFLIYNMETPQAEPESVLLKDLAKEHYRLAFLVKEEADHLSRELEVSMRAGEIIGQIHDALLEQYRLGGGVENARALNILCTRLVFCLYAEDADIFKKDQLHAYLKARETREWRRALLDLFQTLNTPQDARDPYLEEDLAAFPYVNGGLFKETIPVPQFTPALRQLILQNASLDFDWSEISPTIFGAVFESTLNPATRRSGGMHYTSIENIHKVIDPLFLDSLKDEFNAIKAEPAAKKRERLLADFQTKLAGLTFLDPACGSGNFLTETYLSLRRLENEVIKARTQGQSFLGFEETNPVKVSIRQFRGIEVNDFAVTVATTALWISEAQTLRETEAIVRRDIDFLPLKSHAGIAEGNALALEWPAADYIIGNPPFIGARVMSAAQKADMLSVFGKKWKNLGNMDYVCAWYKRAAEQLAAAPRTRAAFVSTNSITQGEQVALLWKPLVEQYGVQIDFAHRTFRWDSEASQKAHVHCVIVGFSSSAVSSASGTQGVGSAGGLARTNADAAQCARTNAAPAQCARIGEVTLNASAGEAARAPSTQRTGRGQDSKRIFLPDGTAIPADHINAYLMDAPDVFIDSRNKPLCDVPPMVYGNKPTDGGHLFLTAEERDDVLRREPDLARFVRPVLGAQEYINRQPRYCLWLTEATPADIRRSPILHRRVQAVRDYRLASPKAATRQSAETPHLFQEIRHPKEGSYIIVPSVSSELRQYVPIGFMDAGTIVNNAVLIIPSATLSHFAVLTSSVHMAWMRAVCGRLKSDYRYSASVVYNNFPWPGEMSDALERCAQNILDARALYPDSSLADLYDPLTMPAELRKAHRDNDREVLRLYALPADATDEQIVAKLFTMYAALTA